MNFVGKRKTNLQKFLILGMLVFILVGIFVPKIALGLPSPTLPAPANPVQASDIPALATPIPFLINDAIGGAVKTGARWIFGEVVDNLLRALAQLLMLFSSSVLGICGYIFDKTVEFTILNMAEKIKDSGSTSIGNSITTAWATLRDIANMFFIFVLLYAAIRNMFDTNFNTFGTTVKNIVIVALLINFSLFFTKVVIDASNIVAIGFYNSIRTQTYTNPNAYSQNAGTASITQTTGISAGYMRMLNLQTFSSSNILTKITGPVSIILIAIFGSVFMLVTAVMLLIAGIMFAARFIILIFLMILSPLAFIAYLIPTFKKQFTDWREAVVNQSFFAPLYFALTWVVFRLGNSLFDTIKGADTTQNKDWTNILLGNPKVITALIINYVLVMGLSIAALVFAKKMAMTGAMAKPFKAISGGIGAAAMGGTAWAARNTIGRAAGAISESKREKWSQTTLGRVGLWAADKGKKGSFDVRGVADTKLGKRFGVGNITDLAGKASGAGGFKKSAEEKAKRKAEYAKDVYGQTEEEKEKAAELEKRYNDGFYDENGVFQLSNKKKAKQKRKDIENQKEKEEKEVKKAENEAKRAEENAEEKLENKKKELSEAKLPETKDALKKQVEEAEKELEAAKKAHKEAIDKKRLVIEEKRYSNEVTKLEKEAEALDKASEEDKKIWEEARDVAAKRQEEYAKRLENGILGRVAESIGTGVSGTGVGAMVGGAAAGPVGAIIGAPIGGLAGVVLGTLRQNGKAAARAVRKQKKGKTEEEQLAELAKKIAEKEMEKKKSKEGGEEEKGKEKENKET